MLFRRQATIVRPLHGVRLSRVAIVFACAQLCYICTVCVLFLLLFTELSRRGAKVVLLCRSVERGEKAAAEIRALTGGEVVLEQMDLGEN